MSPKQKENQFLAIQGPLGWIALVARGKVLKQLSIGHFSKQDAEMAVLPRFNADAAVGKWNSTLIQRLQAYFAGNSVDFQDVTIDPGPVTPFTRRVIDACRRIGHGQTATYGELAAQIGSPGASRAVGRCMAGNRICLVVPCHRVIRADGCLGGFSAVGGSNLKSRLLALESGRSEGEKIPPIGLESK
jgi:methylated-DNA-[protein]-cysteine S-methyltransferase